MSCSCVKSHTLFPLPILAHHEREREKSSTDRRLHNHHSKTDSQFTSVIHCFNLVMWAWEQPVAAFMWVITSSFLILSNFPLLCCHLDERTCCSTCCPICLSCFYGDSRWSISGFGFFSLSFSASPSMNVWPLRPQHTRETHISENRRDRRVLILSLLDVVPLFSTFDSKIHPQPRREPTMSGKERSPRHRPWSVYRANTFDLSAEMMGLALSGN